MALSLFGWLLTWVASLLTMMEQVVEDLALKWKIEDTEELATVKFGDIDQLTLKRFWLVGRLLTSKPYSSSSLMSKMKNIWRTREEVEISEWNGSDRLLFAFRNDGDRRQVMRGGPWKFDNAMLVLAVTDGSDPTSVQLNT